MRAGTKLARSTGTFLARGLCFESNDASDLRCCWWAILGSNQ